MSATQMSPVNEDRIPFATTEITPAAQQAVAEVLSSGWVTTGPKVVEFEREFGALVRAPEAIAVASCTAAIELALRALDLPRGAKVLTSTMTFCGAVHAIVHAGLQPVLVDLNPSTLMPDEDTTAQAAERAGGVDAMVVLHFAGQPAPVRSLAEAAGLPLERVIEDAAHAVGTWVDDEPVGNISAATCFSFYATKNLPIGEGGMVTTSDAAIADRVRKMRLHGMSRDAWKRYMPGNTWRYEVDVAGLKANMTDIQAAIGLAQLTKFADWQERRSQLADRYDHELFAVPGISRPARPARGLHAWHLYVIKVDPRRIAISRDEFMDELNDLGIGTSVHFIPAHHQPYFRRLLGEEIRDSFPMADSVFDRILSLPLHPGLADADVDRVCQAVLDVVSRPRRTKAKHRRSAGVATMPQPRAPQVAK